MCTLYFHRQTPICSIWMMNPSSIYWPINRTFSRIIQSAQMNPSSIYWPINRTSSRILQPAQMLNPSSIYWPINRTSSRIIQPAQMMNPSSIYCHYWPINRKSSRIIQPVQIFNKIVRPPMAADIGFWSPITTRLLFLFCLSAAFIAMFCATCTKRSVSH